MEDSLLDFVDTSKLVKHSIPNVGDASIQAFQTGVDHELDPDNMIMWMSRMGIPNVQARRMMYVAGYPTPIEVYLLMTEYSTDLIDTWPTMLVDVDWIMVKDLDTGEGDHCTRLEVRRGVPWDLDKSTLIRDIERYMVALKEDAQKEEVHDSSVLWRTVRVYLDAEIVVDYPRTEPINVYPDFEIPISGSYQGYVDARDQYLTRHVDWFNPDFSNYSLEHRVFNMYPQEKREREGILERVVSFEVFRRDLKSLLRGGQDGI